MSEVPASKDLPAVGVIIVNYNSGAYLRRCIDSVLQSDTSLEIVVVDNNSIDGSIDSIRNLDTDEHQLHLIANVANLGFSRGVNIGRKRIDCNHLLILNPDCVIHPHTVTKLILTLESQPSTGLVGPIVFNEDGTEQRGCRRNEPTLKRSVITALGLRGQGTGVDLTGQPLPSNPVAVDAVSGSCMLISSALFDRLGGMDERYFLHCEDLDLCRRVRDAGHQVMFDPGVSIFHRQGGSGGAGFMRVEKLKHESMLRYYRQHHVDIDPKHSIVTVWSMNILVWGHFAMALGLHQINRLRDTRLPATDPPLLPLPLDTINLVVSGANSDVGDSLLGHLREQGRTCIALTRQRQGRLLHSRNIRWLQIDYFNLAPRDDLPSLKAWVHLAPVWTTGQFESLVERCGVGRIIGLGSTSIVAKSDSEDVGESNVVQKLRNGEQAVISLAAKTGAAWTILRPTLIYGGQRNRNINLVKKVISVTRCFPIVGEGQGKRQPVHADDVATACLRLLKCDRATGVYDLPGGETLTYREMVERVFESLGQKTRIVTIAPRFAEVLLRLISRIPGLAMLTPQMAHRMSKDQVFSGDRATAEFDYRPGPFRP